MFSETAILTVLEIVDTLMGGVSLGKILEKNAILIFARQRIVEDVCRQLIAIESQDV